jgi:transposase-like protein
MRNRKEYTAEYKAKIVLEVLKEEKTLSEIAAREGVNPNQIGNWKREFLNNTSRVFSQNRIEKDTEKKLEELKQNEKAYQAKVGQLTLEVDFLKEVCEKLYGSGWENRTSFKR